MIHFVFVDDEEYICNQFEEIFSWIDENVSLVATFKNVTDTLNFIKKNKVDAIITDISLKNENGISIAKYVYENKLPIHVILLSAHKSFEYAQEGYKYNVFSYITKPFSISDLKDTISRLKNKMNIDDSPVSKNYQPLIDILFPFLQKDGFLTTDKDFWSCFLHIDYSFDDSHILSDSTRIFSFFENIFNMQKNTAYTKLLSCNDNYSTAIVFCEKNVSLSDFQELINSVCTSITNDCLNISNIKVDISATPVFSNISDMFEERLVNDTRTSAYFINCIMDQLITKSENDAIDIISKTLDLISSKRALVNFMTLLSDALEFNIPKKILNSNNSDIKNFVIKNIKIYFLNHSKTDVITYVCNYIENHYRENISLFSISNEVNMNSAYLSRYFKQKKGVNFSEYLISVRMKKACELLDNEDYSIENICYMVGYNNTSLFYKTFKNLYGKTPMEYRKNKKGV